MRVDAGFFFPKRANHGDSGVLGTEPTDGWDSVILSPSQAAHCQWLTKTIDVTLAGEWLDTRIDPLGVATAFGHNETATRTLYTTYNQLYNSIVTGAEGLLLLANHVEIVLDAEDDIRLPIWYAVGGYYTPGTEGAPDILSSAYVHRMVNSLGVENSTTEFIIPSSIAAGNAGGNTIFTPDSFPEPPIGTCRVYSDSAPVSVKDQPTSVNWSMSFPIFNNWINTGSIGLATLDVDIHVTAWLIAPTVP